VHSSPVLGNAIWFHQHADWVTDLISVVECLFWDGQFSQNASDFIEALEIRHSPRGLEIDMKKMRPWMSALKPIVATSSHYITIDQIFGVFFEKIKIGPPTLSRF